MADEDAVLQIEVVDQRRNIAAVVLDRAFMRPAGGGAMTAQVARDDLVVLAEKRDLLAPVAQAAGEAVDENERRRAAPAGFEVQLFHLGVRLVRRHQLLLQLRRRRLVVAELQVVRAVSCRKGLQPCRKLLELG